MLVSIIVPTCNRNDLLVNCLDLLSPEKQSAGFEYELIVTDDSKDNQARSLIEQQYPWARWVEGPKSGPAANRNNGAKMARGKWLLFIDDDCLPDVHILKEYAAARAANPDVLVFEGCITVDRPQESFIEESPVNETGGFLWACNFLMDANLFLNELKGFDEDFPYAAMEDVDLDYRLKKKQIEVLFVKNAFVVHPWRMQKKVYEITMKRFRSLLYFLNKHPEMSKKLGTRYFLHMVYNAVRALGKDSRRYKFRGFGSRLVYIWLHFYFAIYFLFKQYTIPAEQQ
ncbi:glycosyltransferase family 2 protein [Mucilaginibacter sp. PPCGB 2223]|uniref:glycosyltransferase family 2 protein n=1 Tax=Mucilaginibacter sp. PPCGB 2223 TaxID=1886027 RepID=UPI001111B1CC|nr:glycosyltransferase [Mucilaginibacter sp. PPCGB 2223]